MWGWCRTRHLPGFNQNPNARPHEDHPTGVLIVVNEVQQNDYLYDHVCYDLEEEKWPEVQLLDNLQNHDVPS